MWKVAHSHQHVAAADVDLVLKSYNDRVADLGPFIALLTAVDAGHAAADAGRQGHHLFAKRDAAGNDLPGKTAKVPAIGVARPDHILDRQAKINDVAAGADVDSLQMV